MIKKGEFPNTMIGVSLDGWPFLIKGDPELVKLMDGASFADNSQSIEEFPKKAGVYICTIEFWFEQGYFEGWEAYGESEWDFIPINIKEIEVDNG